MQINMCDLKNNLIGEFAYHDAEILKVSIKDNDVTILLMDGWGEGQMDELCFTNCKISNQDNLENRTIYQLDDIVNFMGTRWYMSLLIWNADGLLEKVSIEADNIISKKYQIQESILETKRNKTLASFNELIEKIGDVTVEKIQSKEMLSFIDNVRNENEAPLYDFNNYKFVCEEDLNKAVYNKK